MASLSGKTALVFGATNPGNMGDAIARLYAAEGAKVILAGRKRAALEDLAREINARAELCDIAEEQQVVALAEAIKANYGQLDIIANTVGVTAPIPLRRLATVEDIANTALFLAQGSYFDTGQIIQVNGGFSLLDNGILFDGNT